MDWVNRPWMDRSPVDMSKPLAELVPVDPLKDAYYAAHFAMVHAEQALECLDRLLCARQLNHDFSSEDPTPDGGSTS
jgi:hypothetical protein